MPNVANLIKSPQLLNVQVKASRGLTATVAVLEPIRAVWLAPTAESALVSLRPGEEVMAIIELAGIPADANMTQLTAGLVAAKEDADAGHVEQKSTVERAGDQPVSLTVQVQAPTSPTNLAVRLEGGEIFWTFANTLTPERSYNFPDLAEEVNKYLDRLQKEAGEVQLPLKLPFLIKSDSAGKVRIAVYPQILYSRLKTQGWTNELDGTTRVDRNLTLDFATMQDLPLDPLAASAIVLHEIRLDIGGAFGPERLLGRAERHDQREFATISSDYALAQGFVLSMPIQCAGVSGLFTTAAEAEIYVEIQHDNHGFPAADGPLAQSNLSLAAPEPGANLAWTFAPFAAPADLQAGIPYWLIIKGVRGKVRLALQAQEEMYLTNLLVNRGGQLWKPLGPATQQSLPLLRLVYLPEIDNQTAAITLRVQGTSLQQALDPTPEARNVTLTVSGQSSGPAILVVESQAQGVLSVANIIQEYIPRA
jgi:hypothetical protein